MQIGVAVSLGLLLIESFKSGDPVFVKTPLTRPLIVLIILSIVSTIFSEYKLYAWEGLLLLLVYIAAYFIVQTVVRTRKQQRIIVYTLIATALTLCIIGLLKRFGLNPFFFWDYGELKCDLARVTATYTNHNHLAGFLEIAIPFALALFLIRSRRLAANFLLIYIVLILLVTQGMTLSRGGWVSAISSITFMGGYLQRQRQFRSKKFLLVIAGIALVVSIFAIASTPVVERVLSLGEQDESVSMEGRLDAWKGTVRLIKTAPLLGNGSGTYEALFTRFQPSGLKPMFIQAHNDYLQAVADLGLPIIFILAWVGCSLVRLMISHLSSSSRQVSGVSLAILGCFIALLFHSVGDFNSHIPANAYVFTVILGVVKYSEKERF